jgi:serine protease Do
MKSLRLIDMRSLALFLLLLAGVGIFFADAQEGGGWIGLGIGLVPPSIRAEAAGVDEGGAFVYYVIVGSPAEHAGLLPGDLIYRVGNVPVEGPDQVTRIFHEFSPQDRVDLGIARFGAMKSFMVTLQAFPDLPEGEGLQSRIWPGFSVAKLTGDILGMLKLAHIPGSFVIGRVETGSPAYIGGLRTGDIISHIAGSEVNSFEDFYHSINSETAGISLQIYRRGRPGTVEIKKTAKDPED